MEETLTLIYDKEAINLELLHEELTTELGPYFVGVSTGSETHKISIHVKAEMPSKMQTQVAAIVQSHVATHLTLAQQAKAEHTAFVKRLKQKSRAEWTEEDKNSLLWILAQQLDVTE